MYNELVSYYIYGVACLIGGFYIGMMWKVYKDEDGDGV
jgi:hypothetical protein